tara:strand:- start:1484 stop:2425 length:942 start_codon:yes stop_codon:yes gene_type:complete
MNSFNLLQSQIVFPESRKEKIAIVDITPELASYLLEVNFANNRTVSWEHVKRMAADMKAGLWVLSNDAVCLDDSGHLINASHRMNAVKLSETTQRFVVVWDLPLETAQLMDVGRKRTMHERITISGCKMTIKECAVTRHAMNAYGKAALGTVEYAYTRHDKLVEKYYCLHSEFLQAINAKQMTGASFIKSAALRIYVEMTHYRYKHAFKHDMTAFDRSMLFIDLVEEGYSRHGGFSLGSQEVSAIKLKNMKDRRRTDAKGQYWADKDAFQYTVSMAYKFMTGEAVENVSRYKTDPFSNFLDAPSTNAGGNESA